MFQHLFVIHQLLFISRSSIYGVPYSISCKEITLEATYNNVKGYEK